jgi:CheY-like chemotaxis protein
MEKKKALIVDDMIINRSTVAGFLLAKGLQIEQCEDGLKALKFVEANKYDLIFSDIEMPNMNGYELLSRIRRSTNNSKTPVVMLSSLNKPDEIDKAKKLGANHYIVKPFTTEKMLQALKVAGVL